jgi:hypothetical protein
MIAETRSDALPLGTEAVGERFGGGNQGCGSDPLGSAV